MTEYKNLVIQNFRTIFIVISFLVTVYVQHIINTAQINELKERTLVLDIKIKDQYEKIDAIKLDKAVFDATMTQVTSMKSDLQEMRTDIKELLKTKR